MTIDGDDFLLGPYGSPEADQAYRRILAQYLAKEGPFAVHDDPVTITELVASYWLFAVKYYGFDKEPGRGDAFNLKRIIGILDNLYGDTKAADFGPLDLRAVQGEMIRLGWCRTLINHEMGRTKRIFRWAVSEELIPASVWHSLQACPGLRRGRTDAKESEPVKPVAIETVEATKKYLRPAIRAIIDFMLATGCRPNEACQLRPCDLDKTNPKCWIFRPVKHKTEHHGHERLVLVGPRAQEVLLPFLTDCPPDAWIFSPSREEDRRHSDRHAARQAKMTLSAITRMERAKVVPRKRPPTNRYTTASVRCAIDRACRKAGILPVWGPNRLRHTRATELRPHGLDVVATVLGHSKLETTQVYSEKNLAAAMALVERVG